MSLSIWKLWEKFKIHPQMDVLARRWPILFVDLENEVWKEWADLPKLRDLNLRPWEFRELKAIVSGDYRFEFRARALWIILSPRLELAPFHFVSTEPQRNYVYGEIEDLQTWPMELLKLAAALVATFMELVVNNRVQVGSRDELIYGYNRWIRQLLPHLALEDQLTLVKSYQLNDPTAYYGMDDASGYQPWQSLMWDRKIALPVKIWTDERIRQIVIAEQSGQQAPRADHEKALECYVEAVSCWAGLGELPYSPDLLAAQIGFILQYAADRNPTLLWPFNFTQTLMNIAGPSHAATRHLFAQVMIDSVDELRLANSLDVAFVEGLADEVELFYDDENLADTLRGIASRALQRLEREREHQVRIQHTIAAVLERMK